MHILPRSWAIAVVAGIAVIGALAFAHARSGRYGLPYSDHFGQGNMADWTAYGGNWHVVNGVMQNDSDDRGPKLIAGSKNLTDYQIDADVQLTSRFGDAGVLLRVTDPEEGANAFNGYYVGVRLPDLLLIGKVDMGFRPLSQITMHEPATPNSWQHLQVRMQGCELTVHAEDLSRSTLADAKVHDDDCYRHGSFGLRSFESGGMWRNVHVRPLP